MGNFDKFARALLEEAKRFFEKAQERPTLEEQQPFLHAALVLGFSAFEAHINAIADDFLVRSELQILDQSILAEKDYRLVDGRFTLTENLKIYRLTDRIEFLFRRFSGTMLDKSQPWWNQLKNGLNARNELTHPNPKQNTMVTELVVQQALQGILDALEALYKAVYKRKYPLHKRGLSSTLTF